VAGAPPLLLLILLISVVVLLGRGPHPAMSLRDLAVPLTLLEVLVMAGCGYLGSRALKRRSTALVVGLVCGAYVALTGLAISGMMVAVISHAGTRRIAGNIWWIVILVAELSVLLLGALAYRAYRNRQVSA
jgi:ABC-type transport system involved in multi-copper enzyme maturation permease subunit